MDWTTGKSTRGTSDRDKIRSSLKDRGLFSVSCSFGLTTGTGLVILRSLASTTPVMFLDLSLICDCRLKNG